jgi:hypothetical protein
MSAQCTNGGTCEWIGQQRLPAEQRLDRLGEILTRHTKKESEA